MISTDWSARDCVITAAYGVGPNYVETFLRTFRVVNRSARIILLVTRLSRLAGVAEKYGAEMRLNSVISMIMPGIDLPRKRQRIRLSEILGRTNPVAPRLARWLPRGMVELMVPLPLARFFHIRRVLERESVRTVLLSDCRDVLFQTDPFAHAAELVLAQEPTAFQDPAGRFNERWIRDGFGQAALNGLMGKPVYCSGTILGEARRVRMHVDRICAVACRLRTWARFGIDQGVHNFIVHTEYSPSDYTVSTNEAGLIATLGLEKNLRVREGWVVDAAGDPFAIVHQYDRVDAACLAGLRALATQSSNWAMGY